MVCMSYGILACWFVGLFLLGGCIGGLIVYKIEERDFKTMTAQCESLALEEERLRREREDYNNTHAMIDTIDDLPEYLRDKYEIFEKQAFTDSDEDIAEMYV